MNSLKLLFTLYVRPLAALNRIIDEGNWLHGAVGCLARFRVGLGRPCQTFTQFL